MGERERKKAIDTAKDMLKLKENVKFIVQVTGLSKDEIEKLIR